MPVVQVVHTGVFLLTTHSLQKWTSLDALKANSWDLEGRDKVLLVVVPDSVILCSATILLGLNVLAPRKDIVRPMRPIQDKCRTVICLTGTEIHSIWSLIELRTQACSTAPVMQL